MPMKHKLFQQHTFTFLKKKRKHESVQSQTPCESLAKGILLPWGCCNLHTCPPYYFKIFELFFFFQTHIKERMVEIKNKADTDDT